MGRSHLALGWLRKPMPMPSYAHLNYVSQSAPQGVEALLYCQPQNKDSPVAILIAERQEPFALKVPTRSQFSLSLYLT